MIFCWLNLIKLGSTAQLFAIYHNFGKFNSLKKNLMNLKIFLIGLLVSYFP